MTIVEMKSFLRFFNCVCNNPSVGISWRNDYHVAVEYRDIEISRGRFWVIRKRKRDPLYNKYEWDGCLSELRFVPVDTKGKVCDNEFAVIRNFATKANMPRTDVEKGDGWLHVCHIYLKYEAF